VTVWWPLVSPSGHLVTLWWPLVSGGLVVWCHPSSGHPLVTRHLVTSQSVQNRSPYAGCDAISEKKSVAPVKVAPVKKNFNRQGMQKKVRAA